jgi:hypothetical protein
MSWLFSQALVEEYSEANYSDGEPSAPSSGSHTQLAYLPPDRMTASSRLSRFGMTFKPLTESHGEELLMSYLAAFHVRTSASQDAEQELTESDQECGTKWRGWLAKYDRVTSSWKTAQCSFIEDLSESLATLPRSGMTRDGLLWELPMLERRTSETGSGSWPTPIASDSRGSSGQQRPGKQVQLVDAVKKYPTPTRRDYKSGTGAQDRPGHSPPLSNVIGGTLNPTWVEWLMGWPLGWTDLKPLEMDKSHCAQQQRGDSLQEDK